MGRNGEKPFPVYLSFSARGTTKVILGLLRFGWQ